MRSIERVDDALLRRLLRRLRDELVLRRGPDFVALVLFGSRGRGDARYDSDIDLLLVAGEPRHRDGLGGAREALEGSGEHAAWVRERGRPTFGVVALTPAEAAEGRYLYLDLVDDGVIVHDVGAFMERRLDAFRARMRELGSYRVRFADGSAMWLLKPGMRAGETVEI